MAGHSPDVTAAVSIPVRDAQPDFDTLYEEHVDVVWRLLQRFGVPEAGLEDAVQDVFIVAHRQLAGFRGESSLKTWLHAIAHKVAKDYRRKEQRKGGWLELEPTMADPGRSPHEAAAQRQQLEAVLRLLEAMEETQRTVFVLTEFQGMTAPEIAEVMGSSVNTVSSRLRAARQRFNELVAADSEGAR